MEIADMSTKLEKRPPAGGRRLLGIPATLAAVIALVLGASAVGHAAFAAPASTAIRPQSQPRTVIGFAETRHVRDVVLSGRAQPVGRLPANQMMQLDLVLPLRDPAGLDAFLKRIYDPTSPSYRHFLSVAEFTDEFGPSQGDYDAMVDFARTHGFAVVGGTRDSMEVQIQGPVSAVEAAFHLALLTYRHPSESRTFYAPDREPSTDLPFALWHISGLDNYSIPHPMLINKSDYAKAHGLDPESLIPRATTGSGPGASYLGSDMRAAYYGGTALTGAGQNLGLLSYIGTDLADLNTYYTNVHQTNSVPITLLSTDGTSTSCLASQGCDDLEPTIDMTQALGMAPGLSSLVMYVGSTDTAIIGAMTTHNPLPMTIGCSWGWSPVDPATLDPYFLRMAAQGQTFFSASGDSSTWSSSNGAWPADDPNVAAVGGTDLVTAKAAGPWQSETAWVASGGGISPDGISIPWWQQLPGVINSSNKGSPTLRNGPDISANANWSFYVCAEQTTCTANNWGGTSFATPMWAGYMALVNQQLAADGNPAIGFINSLIYEFGVSPSYDTVFHDITSGTSGSYAAVPGYDLVTGWGSPNGGNLITALVRKPVLASELDSADVKNAVYYLGFDSNLYELGWDWGWTQTQATGTGGRPSVASGTGIAAYVNTIYNGNEVFYLTNSGGNLHIEQLWGSTLSPTDLTVTAGGKAVDAGTNPVGYIDTIAGTDNVFYIGADHMVHALSWSPSSGWQENAQLDAVAPKLAAVGSALSGHMTAKSEEVFYIGSNQHVYELWRWSKNFDGWHSTDVTQASGVVSVAAAGSPLAGFCDTVTGDDAIFYLAANQHVYELLFGSNSEWSAVDVTVNSGTSTTAAAGSALAAHLNTVAGSEEVFYLDSNRNVQEFWAASTSPLSWHASDVTTAAGGAPLAFAGSPVSTDVSTIDNTDHVFYIGVDQNVHELWWNGTWHYADDTTQTAPAAPNAVP
jgi:hypothetical protein